MCKVHAFDIDGTITTNDNLWECLEKEYPKFNRANHNYYDIRKTLLEQNAIQREDEYSNYSFFTKYGDKIYYEAKIHDYILNYIRGLINKGEEVIFITARPDSETTKTVEWLKKNELPTDKVYFTNGKTKNPLLIKFKVTHFYEDKYEAVVEADKSPYMEEIYLLNYPYNQGEIPRKCVRIASWVSKR